MTIEESGNSVVSTTGPDRIVNGGGIVSGAMCSSSQRDVNTLPSPSPCTDVGPLPDHYVDPKQEAREDRDCPAHRRRLDHLVRSNLRSMFKDNWNSLVDLTVTFPPDNGVPLDTLDVQSRLTHIRPHFDRLFLHWFLVLE